MEELYRNNVFIGIDIGGTNTQIGVVDLKGRCLAKQTIPTLADEPASELVKRIVRMNRRLLKQLSCKADLAGIGIAAPAANYFNGMIEAPSNFSWGSVNFVEMMKRYYHLPIAITNDAKAAALGEMIYGAARDVENFVVITLGTGLGCGVVCDGEVIQGNRGLAGELGHCIIVPNGRQCSCGRQGCLETYVSAKGICRTVFELLCNYLDDSPLRKMAYHKLTAEKIAGFALKGDKLAIEAFRYTGTILGKKLAGVVTYYSPEAIILFGGVTFAGELLLQPIREHFSENLLGLYQGGVRIGLSEVQNGNAAILGATALIVNEIQNKRNV